MLPVVFGLVLAEPPPHPVPQPRDPALVSRTVYPDGAVDECRRIAPPRQGWLTVECRTGPFVGHDVYRPLERRSPEPQPAVPAPTGRPPFLRPPH